MRRGIVTALVLALSSCAASEPAGPAAPSAASPASPWPSLAEASWSRVRAMDGSELDLSAAARNGRAVALVFWLPWCATCLAEGPTVAAAARRLADELLIVGVVSGPDGDVDDDEVRAVVERLELTYPHVRDRDMAMARDLRVTGTPTIVVYGPDGRLKERSSHVHDWDALAAELR